MLTIGEGLLILHNTVSLGESGYHENYKRVNELAELYKTLITGEGVEKILRRYSPRETEEQFKQRLNITQTITPAVSEKIMAPFNKVCRIDTVQKKIYFKEGDNEAIEKKVAEIQKTINEFWGDETLDNWLETRYVELVFTDPNSFVIVEFKAFDANKEKAKPYPFEVSSKNAINYSYTNNVLDFLIVEKSSSFISTSVVDKVSTDKINEGKTYFMYLPDYVIKLVEVDKSKKNIEFKNITEIGVDTEGVYVFEIDGRYFRMFIYNPKAGEVQAIQLGYKRDLLTKGMTFVSPIHPAVPRMIKCVQAVSELDLTTKLHAYPQKIQYVKKCAGKEENPCRNGIDRDGKTCSVCNGTGEETTHKSTSDVLTVPFPKDPQDMFDIGKLIDYKSPPVDLIKWQDEYVDKLEAQAIKDIFASEAFNRVTATKTATEKELDYESVYDTLFPYGNKISAVWKKLVSLNAKFIDNDKGLVLEHKFPKDLKLKSVDTLLSDLKSAKEANTTSFLKIEIENDIASKIYSENPEALRRYRIKQQHQPFSGKTPEEIQVAMNMNLTRKYDKVLFANFDSIIEEIVKEQLNSEADFFYMPYDERETLIKAKVEQYITDIDSATTTAFGFGEGNEAE